MLYTILITPYKLKNVNKKLIKKICFVDRKKI